MYLLLLFVLSYMLEMWRVSLQQKDDSYLKMEGGGRTQGVSRNIVPKLKK